MNENKSFLGTGWAFPPEFSPRSKLARMVSDEDDIRQSLWILLSTSPGERIMHPVYGCGLKSMVFDHMSEGTITHLKDLVERAILFFEPRITLNRIEVDLDSLYDGLIRLHFDYTVRATNSRSNMVYPFYLLEGTDVRDPFVQPELPRPIAGRATDG